MERTVDLWAYLPEFLKEFLELDKTLLAEEVEFQHLADNLESLQNNLFILTATESGLSEYEKILKIKPDAGDPIETRRTSVLTQWNNIENFTIRTLKKKIDAIQGDGESVVEISADDPFMLHIVCSVSTMSQINALMHILGSTVPANMLTHLENEIRDMPPIAAFFGLASVDIQSVTSQTNQTDVENDGWLLDEGGNIIADEYGMIVFDDEVIA